MKYWIRKYNLAPDGIPFATDEYIQSETKPTEGSTISQYFEITKEQYDLLVLHKIKTPDNDPATGKPWASEIAKQNWIKLQLWEHGVRKQADKGQEVENVIELNELIRGFLSKKLRTYEGFMFNHLRHNNESGYDTISIKRTEIISKLSQVERFEADIAIATNSDPTHQITFTDETEFIEILKEIKSGDTWRWTNITKILKVEEAYEPAALVEEYKKLQQAVNNHIQQIDPNIVNGKDTLSHELGGTTK